MLSRNDKQQMSVRFRKENAHLFAEVQRLKSGSKALSVRPTYSEYMNSDDWRRRKTRYFTKHKKKCANCDSVENIHLHHVHYGRLGREKDKDLIPLCSTCHELFHENYKTKTKMVSETEEFIKEGYTDLSWI